MNTIIGHIMKALQDQQNLQQSNDKDHFGRMIDPQYYSGQIIQPNQNNGYFMNLYDPQQYMASVDYMKRQPSGI